MRVQAIESPGLRECTAGGSRRVLCASTIKGLVCGYEVEGLGFGYEVEGLGFRV